MRLHVVILAFWLLGCCASLAMAEEDASNPVQPTGEPDSKPVLRLGEDEESCKESLAPGEDILAVDPSAKPCAPQTKQPHPEADHAPKPQRPRILLEASVGAGGFYGSDALNPCLLWQTRLLVRAVLDLYVFADLHGATMPWLDYQQAATSANLGLRYELPLGFFVGAGGGVAWLWLRKRSHQESTLGLDLSAHVGYRYDILPWLAVQVQSQISARELEGWYLAFGGLAGPHVRF